MSVIDGFDLNNFNFMEWDYLAIYEGIFLPENNAIVLIQNFWLTVTSSIGYLFLIPFYVKPLPKCVEPDCLELERSDSMMGRVARNFLPDYDFDTSVTYVGVMSPEENMIVIIQNILLFISSSIGYLLLVPFYQRMSNNARVEVTSGGQEVDTVSAEVVSYVTWILRYMADGLDDTWHTDTDSDNFYPYPYYNDYDTV